MSSEKDIVVGLFAPVLQILSKGTKPSDSLSFVFKNDDSVEIHLISINLIGLSFWN